MNIDQTSDLKKLEEIENFRLLLVDVKPSLDQTLNQIFRKQKEIYIRLFPTSEKKRGNDFQEKVLIEESIDIAKVAFPSRSSVRALFLFKDSEFRNYINNLLPEDITCLKDLNELNPSETVAVVLFSQSAARLVSDDLRDKIQRIASFCKVIYMIVFSPESLPNDGDGCINVGEVRLETYAFTYDKQYKKSPWRRNDNKKISDILEIAGYRKQENLRLETQGEQHNSRNKFLVQAALSKQIKNQNEAEPRTVATINSNSSQSKGLLSFWT